LFNSLKNHIILAVFCITHKTHPTYWQLSQYSVQLTKHTLLTGSYHSILYNLQNTPYLLATITVFCTTYKTHPTYWQLSQNSVQLTKHTLLIGNFPCCIITEIYTIYFWLTCHKQHTFFHTHARRSPYTTSCHKLKQTVPDAPVPKQFW